MPVELLALGASLAYATGQVVTKFATRSGSVVAGFVVSLAAGTVALGVAAAVVVPTWQAPAAAWLLFALAGLFGAGVGRLLLMRGVRDAGASVSAPVQSSTQPLAATLAAVVVLGERVGPGRLLALGLVVTGLWLCARGGSANRRPPQPVPSGQAAQPVRSGWAVLRVVWWPMAAGLALATADVLRKSGLDQHADAVLGAFVGVAAACAGWLVVLGLRRWRGQPAAPPPSYWWYGLHGLLTAVAAVLLLSALRHGDLSVVAPLVATQPVFVVALGAVLLRDLEKVRPGTVLGAVVVFAGVAAMSLTDGG